MAKKLPVWTVFSECNGRIESVNIFEYGQFEAIIKKLRKMKSKFKKDTKDVSDEEMAGRRSDFLKSLDEELRHELLYYFWSKCEHEIILANWPPRVDVDAVRKKLDEYAVKCPDWRKDRRCVVELVDAGSYPSCRKIDIYEQIMSNFEHFARVVHEYIGV